MDDLIQGGKDAVDDVAQAGEDAIGHLTGDNPEATPKSDSDK